MSKILNHIEEYLLIVLFPLMTIVVFAATVIRYLKLGSFPWTEELARYIMIWMAYLGASLAMKKNAHLGVEAFVKILPDFIIKYINIFRIIILILFNGMVIYFSIQIMTSQMKMGQTSPALNIPIWIAYLAVPTGALLMCIRVIQGVFYDKEKTSEGGQ